MTKLDRSLKILITGSNGQLGRSFKKAFEHAGEPEVHLHSRDSLDITDQQAILREVTNNKPDWIINCAAYTAVDRAESEEEHAFKVNAEGPEILAKAAESVEARLVHFSTDYVFSGRTNQPYTEENKAVPHSVYGSSKLAGESQVLKFCKRGLVFRTSWLYSWEGKNFYNTMRRLGKERDWVDVVYDQIGTPTYTGHLAWAVVKAMVKVENDDDEKYYGLFHLTNEGVGSWYDFACSIMKVNELNCRVRAIESSEYPTEATRPPYSLLSKRKFQSTFGFAMPHWLEGLHSCAKNHR